MGRNCFQEKERSKILEAFASWILSSFFKTLDFGLLNSHFLKTNIFFFLLLLKSSWCIPVGVKRRRTLPNRLMLVCCGANSFIAMMSKNGSKLTAQVNLKFLMFLQRHFDFILLLISPLWSFKWNSFQSELVKHNLTRISKFFWLTKTKCNILIWFHRFYPFR